MKLWVKTAIGLGLVGSVSGMTIGGMAVFNATSKSVNGASFNSAQPMTNGYNIPSIQQLKLENLDTYFVKNIAYNTDVFAKYNAEKNEVTYNDKIVPFDKFNKAYVRKFNDSPVQVVRFGPAVFQNEYIDAVSPKEFAQYVVWFLKNVSWGGDLAALENFSLRRGIKADGSAVILGEHTNKNNEQTTIEFYPDGFFGSLPAFSSEGGRGQQADNLLTKLSDINNTLLTLDDIQQLLDKKQEIKSLANIADFRIRSIVPVQTITDPKDATRNGQMGYEAYIDIYPHLIDDVLEIYPYLAKELDGWHVERDPKIEVLPSGTTYHKDKLVNGKYWGIDPSSRIPFLALLAASNPDFKGVGINWLKYVGQHEYGHHITLQSLQDGSENGAYIGAASAQKTLSPGNYYSLNAINKYLEARAKNISATKTGTEEKSVGEFIRFVEGADLVNDQESNKDVYGSIFATDLVTAVENERRRAGRSSLDELAKVAQTRGVSLQDLIIENAWDLNSASINPGFTDNANVYSFDKQTGKAILVSLKDTYQNVFTDGQGTPIVQDSAHDQAVVQWWVDNNGKLVEPAYWQINQTQGGQTLGWTKPKDSTLTKRKTVVMTKELDANGKPIPAIKDDCTVNELYRKSKEITDYLLTFAWDYSVNGWESESTLSSGIRFDETAYKPATGEDLSDKYSASTVEGYSRLLSAGENAFFTFIQRSQTGLSSFETKDGDYFSPKLTTTGQNVNQQLATMGNYILKFDEQGFGFGAEKGLGAYFDVDGVKYTSLPSGNFTEWSRQGNRHDTAWETLISHQKTGLKQTDGMFVISKKNDSDTMLAIHGVEENGATVRKFVFVDSKTGTDSDAFFPIDAAKDAKNESAMYIIDSEFNVAGNSVKGLFPKVTFNAKYLSNDLKAWKVGGAKAGQMTIADYVKQLSLDPLNDFEFGKDTTNIETTSLPMDAKGKTVIKKSALDRFFDVDAFMQDNNLSETAAQAILTLLVVQSNMAFIQEFDSTQATEANLKTNASLKAYLLQADTVKNAKDPLFSTETGIRKWYIKEITDADYESFIEGLFKAKQDWHVKAPSLPLDENSISFNELTMLTGIRRFSFLTDSDFAYKMTVGPTSDLRGYLQARNEDKLSEIFSDYTFDVAEMTNRDYLQITYTPSQEKLENTPSWFNGTSESESGFEYSIDSSSTASYLSSSILAASFQDKSSGLEAVEDAIKTAFHFTINKWGEVEPTPDEQGKMVSPSKGIIAVSNLYHWKNFVNPNFIGKPTAMANGYLKDDFIRRSVGTEIYDMNGSWKYNLIGSDVYNAPAANSTTPVVPAPQSSTPIGKYFKGTQGTLKGSVIVDATGLIVAKNDGLNFIGEKGTIAENWEMDTSGNFVDKITKALIGQFSNDDVKEISNKAVAIKDVNGAVLAYITNNVLTIDNNSIQYKVVDKSLYKFDVNADYSKLATVTQELKIQGNEIYNLDGTAIKDDRIRLKTIKGETIDNRATAVWEWLLQSKGIGDGLTTDPNDKSIITNGGRNIEGIWRSPERDATYAWGYIPIKQNKNGKEIKASDVKYLEYKDIATGQTHYVPVSIGQNNLYYYQDRSNLNEYYEVEDTTHKNTTSKGIYHIEDEGFTSWTSDFVSMGGYQDAFLQTGHQYLMTLVDGNHNEVMKIDLGSRQVIAENGKPAGKAPNVIRKNDQGEAVISIQDQFNN